MTVSRLPELKNDLLIRAAFRRPTEHVPVWLMRQAGRYLPEFRAIRAEADFFTVCRTPEMAAEVTLQPLRRFALDAAIIFSDILVVPQAMGMNVEMLTGFGPNLPKPLSSPADLHGLSVSRASDELEYVYDAVSLTRKKLEGRVPLIGFAGAPWTLMTYMVEGGGSRTLSKAKSWLYAEPSASEQLLETIADVVIDYLIRQAGAGAQVLQIFDSWAGILAPAQFLRFAFPPLARIATEVKAAVPAIPLIVFARGANEAIDALSRTEYDVVSLNWTVSPQHARSIAGDRVALQGNLDPCALYAPPEVIREEVVTMINAFGTQGYIANLGHGMHPDHDPGHVAAFVNAVHEVSASVNKEKQTAGRSRDSHAG